VAPILGAMTTHQLQQTSAVDQFLAAVVTGRVTPDPWATGAVVDAVVPGWRFTMEGADAIAEGYSGWFAHPGHLDELTRTPTPTGEVLEYTVGWTEDGIAYAARHVHVLTLDASGRIEADHVWCGGRWPADLLAQMEGG
jgi:hypothetical protein